MLIIQYHATQLLVYAHFLKDAMPKSQAMFRCAVKVISKYVQECQLLEVVSAYKEMYGAKEERYHPARALSSLVRFTGKDICLMKMQRKGDAVAVGL